MDVGTVGRDVDNETTHIEKKNDIMYGIGLVAVILVFVLIVLWGLARLAKEMAEKILIK
jgi:flagellar biogenesis protein FliO